MIRLLKRLVDWLDRRFPVKFYVTPELFDDICNKQSRQSKQIEAIRQALSSNEADLKQLEKSIIAIKELLVKGGPGSVIAENRRAEFIANGRMAE